LRRGASLLETVLYIALVVFLLAAVLTTFIQLSDTYQRARAKRVANQNGLAAMERMLREIRLAHDIDDAGSSFGTHPGELTLDTIESPSDPTATTRRFSLSGTALVLSEGGGADAPLTSGARITDLKFYSTTTERDTRAIRIEMTVEAGNGESLISLPFAASAVLRETYQ